MEVICCVCGKVKRSNGWRQVTPRPGWPQSHGYCPECGAAALRAIEELYGAGSDTRQRLAS